MYTCVYIYISNIYLIIYIFIHIHMPYNIPKKTTMQNFKTMLRYVKAVKVHTRLNICGIKMNQTIFLGV